MKQVDLGDCRRAAENLPWYANGSLDVEERRHLQAHLDECASCRRELEFLTAIVESMPSPRAAHDGAPPFSRLLHRINRQERYVHGWKIAAAVLMLVIAVVAVALPVYLFEPRYHAVTDTLPEANERVQLQLTFDTQKNTGSLTQLLERYNADVIAGPAEDGSFLLEFRLAPGETVRHLQQRLHDEAQVRDAELPRSP